MQQLGSHYKDFHEIWYLRIFLNSVEKNRVSLKYDMKTNVHLWYLAQFFLEWEMFGTKVVEKFETHILSSITFFKKLWRLWDNAEKCCRARHATDDNMAHSLCMLIPMATTAHTGCLTLIAFPLQQWSYKHTSVLHYTYIACPVFLLTTCNIQVVMAKLTILP